MKPYQNVPIIESSEPLVDIPTEFAFFQPHMYSLLGAPYADKSPFSLRSGVLQRLIKAQAYLQLQCPNWKIKIFDAYRPIAVQKFMVEHERSQLAKAKSWDLNQLSSQQEQELIAEVLNFWAIPSEDPATPPPHSTGAAIDITLVDHNQTAVNMGSPIDEISPRSIPDYFAAIDTPAAQQAHANRELLFACMHQAGFERHPNEWWHFSYGDQLWAWLRSQNNTLAKNTENSAINAMYGRYE
ncbi:D-Ala-D-Ala dipeptidase [Thalassoporum mexicanum PCC 7367]|uniref:M15 family metallopeptidase n=1 Tax=Thalassoporum mexicanum TaxID=3457544 RepID=UPI00029FD6A0|nr:M15 family metallopeptidase [Pseudanabaena sp. PCC 7367]AFY70512.1 D-Ala-D-Ala dipeptidase [Pseudanabaena sp. PCC 7367]